MDLFPTKVELVSTSALSKFGSLSITVDKIINLILFMFRIGRWNFSSTEELS